MLQMQHLKPSRGTNVPPDVDVSFDTPSTGTGGEFSPPEAGMFSKNEVSGFGHLKLSGGANAPREAEMFFENHVSQM